MQYLVLSIVCFVCELLVRCVKREAASGSRGCQMLGTSSCCEWYASKVDVQPWDGRDIKEGWSGLLRRFLRGRSWMESKDDVQVIPARLRNRRVGECKAGSAVKGLIGRRPGRRPTSQAAVHNPCPMEHTKRIHMRKWAADLNMACVAYPCAASDRASSARIMICDNPAGAPSLAPRAMTSR